MNNWIKVNERLPENTNEVLVLIPDVPALSVRTVDGRYCGFAFAWYADGEWILEGASYFDGKRADLQRSDIAQHITHWMPLPEIPKLEKPAVKIRPNDTVRHKPSGETWVVCGVDHGKGELIPCGHPFPTIAKVSDCELIKENYITKPQSEEHIKELQEQGLERFIDTRSAMLHGIIF